MIQLILFIFYLFCVYFLKLINFRNFSKGTKMNHMYQIQVRARVIGKIGVFCAVKRKKKHIFKFYCASNICLLEIILYIQIYSSATEFFQAIVMQLNANEQDRFSLVFFLYLKSIHLRRSFVS